MTALSLLRPEEMGKWTARLQPFFESVCARSQGRYTTDGIFDRVLKGQWHIWIITEGAEIVFVGGTEIIRYHDTGLKSLVILFGTGKGRKAWQHHMSTVLDWAVAAGCTFAEGKFRIGWGRVLPGWTHSHDVLERALR